MLSGRTSHKATRKSRKLSSKDRGFVLCVGNVRTDQSVSHRRVLCCSDLSHHHIFNPNVTNCDSGLTHCSSHFKKEVPC